MSGDTTQQTNGQTDGWAAATKIADEIPDAEQRQAHYDDARKTFWTTDNHGDWIEVNEASLRRHLRGDGLSGGKPEKGKRLSEIDQKLNEIQAQHNVAYAGPLAGHCSGPAKQYGKRVLVTASPTLVEPAAGEWPVLRKFLDSLLFDERYNQQQYVCAWLKIAYEALRDKSWRGGPAMALAGPRDCGKSLLQKLFTLILGGRAAKPYRYMSGGTQFNADLFGAEHLVIEDEHSSTDIRARRAFGSNIKQFTSNQAQSCHGKGRNALTLAPFWRVSISLNSEAENMMVLPPLSDSEQDSIADKIILLRAQKADLMPTVSTAEYEVFWNRLVLELPAFLYHLANWKIPEEVQHGRFGVKAWQHPELLIELDAHSPETQLLALIEEVIFSGYKADLDLKASGVIPLKGWKDNAKWEGTAEQLEKRLTDWGCSPLAYKARNLLSWGAACGTYLARLAQKHPDRIKRAKRAHANDARGWIIHYSAETAAGYEKAEAKRAARETANDANYRAALASQHAFEAALRRGNPRGPGVVTRG